MQQAARYAYYAVMLADAERELALAEHRKDSAYAAADEYWRGALSDKKTTEAVIKSCVVRDEDYVEALGDEIDARHNHTVLKMIVRALEQRADMLVSLGAHVRAEQSMTGMTIAEQKMDRIVQGVRSTISNRK